MAELEDTSKDLRWLCSRKKQSGRLGSRSFKVAGMSQITSDQ